MTKVIQRFNSAGDYVEHVKACKILPSWSQDYAYDKAADSWAGGSFETGVNLATNGWPEGMAKLQGAMDVLRTQGKGKSRAYDVAGDYPIVARALAGVPDSMTRRVINNASRKPVIDLYISPVMTSQGKADNFILIGSAIVDFIDSLESSGYSVNLLTSVVSQRNGHMAGSVFPLKTGGEALDIEKIIYFIAHPTLLRRLAFRDFQSKLQESELGNGMGRDISHDDHLSIAEKDSIMFVVSTSIVNSINSPIDARAWVHSEVTRQRPELLESMSQAA